jgi:hypothetical protein
MPIDSLKAQELNDFRARLGVRSILGRPREPEVGPPIVQAIAIDVIDVKMRGCAQKKAMKVDLSTFGLSVGVKAVHGTRTTLVSVPPMPGQRSQVAFVDCRNHPVGERKQGH